MNYRNNHMSSSKIAAAVLLLGIVLTMPVLAADESGYALLLQSSPAHGGKVIPGNGVYKMQIGQDVPLIAVPEKGYRFLYWIGDVGQTDITSTTVRMDSPKLIVAVFERDKFEDMEPVLLEASGEATGGMVASPNPLTGTSSIWDTNLITEPTPTPTETKDEFLVPGEKTVPEPMTLLLFGMGSVVLMRVRR
jgi:hypothetical protein